MRPTPPPAPARAIAQVSLPTQYNGKNQDPVGALSSTLARLQVRPDHAARIGGAGRRRPRRGARSLPSIPRVRAVLRPILQANRQLRELREIAKGVTKQLPDAIQNATAKIDEYARGMISGTGSTLFEELGFYYIGPVDGHNLQDLVDVLTGGGQAGGSLLKAPSRGHGRAPL